MMVKYKYPFDYSAEGNWEGHPSIPYGIVERCAHEVRRASGAKYARLLYIGAGHRRGPWGALAIEINGHIYQFGAGISRFPHLIMQDRTLSQSGEKLLGTGLIGKVSVDMLEWHWLHDKCDITFLLNAACLSALEAQWKSFASGKTPTPIFQSWPYTDQYKIPLQLHGLNCTRIQARMIGSQLGMPDLDDDRPLRLFHMFSVLECDYLSLEEHESNPLDDLDDFHQNWTSLTEEEINQLLPEDISFSDYRLLVKSLIPLPEYLIEWYKRGP